MKYQVFYFGVLPTKNVTEISIFLSCGWRPFFGRSEAASENFPHLAALTLLVIDFRVKTVVIVLTRNGFIYFGLNLSTVLLPSPATLQNNDNETTQITIKLSPVFQIKLSQSVSHGSQGQYYSLPTEARVGSRHGRGADLPPGPPALLQCPLQRHTDRHILRERPPSHPYQTLHSAYGEICRLISLYHEES